MTSGAPSNEWTGRQPSRAAEPFGETEEFPNALDRLHIERVAAKEAEYPECRQVLTPEAEARRMLAVPVEVRTGALKLEPPVSPRWDVSVIHRAMFDEVNP